MQTVRLPIEGMTCQGCVRSLTDVLERIRGVKSVDVSLEERTATVDVQQEIVSAEELAAAVAAAGFSVPSTPVADAPGVSPTSEPLAGGPGDNAADPTGEPAGSGGDAMELSFDVAGMHCASCVDQVERALRSVSGVTDAVVNLATAQARVTWRSATHATDADLQQSVAAAVRAAGYEARPRRVNREHIREMQLDEVRGWRIRWLVATVGLGLLLAPTSWWGFAGADLLRLALATVVMVVSGWPFVRGAIARAIRLSANMDTLVAIGSGAAYVSGVVGWLRGGSTMSLMDGAMILAFLSFGRMLEALAKGRASQAVFRLFDLTPQTAALERGASVERVAVSEVERGDVVIVAPGEKAPLDGVVLAGETEMDESWLTGESMPVEKEIGDTVLAAAINGRGALRLRVTRRCGETALDQIAELVQRTQETRAPVQQLADRVVAWFAPVVVLVAIVTFVTWWFIGDAAFAARAAISVLIVACPCAMGLATPTAVLAATGRGAELGILIKDAQTLQSTAQVDTVLLDKTGTLTSGRPAIVLVEPNSGVESGDCVATAAAAAALSHHPLAKAVVSYAAAHGVEFASAKELTAFPGAGVAAENEAGEQILLGSPQLLADRGVAIPQPALDRLHEQAGLGRTTLSVARRGEFVGTLFAADELDAGAEAAILYWRKRRRACVMLTGDNEGAARRVAEQLGITEFHAAVKPDEKLRLLQQRQRRGECVAMIGDGVNDAPALAAADVGIAIGTGADVAIDSADLVLVNSKLNGAVAAFRLAERAMTIIRQNLAWAFLYNLVLIPVAAGVLARWGVHLHPAMAAGAMAMSSVSVVANSLRLRRFSPQERPN